MSKIEQLIKELCPGGVKYKPLKEIGTLVRGNGLQKSDFIDFGYGCIHYGQIYTKFGMFTDKVLSYVSDELAQKLTKVEPGNVILACTSENVEDVCKSVVWLGNKTIVTGGHATVFRHNQNPKYIGYCLNTENFFNQKRKYAYGAKVIDIKIDKLGLIQIPLPPLPIQQEIVRILDTFTEAQTNLEQELELRKKQYEYYLDKLYGSNKDEIEKLGESDGISIMTLSDLGTLTRGKRFVRDDVRESGQPCIHYGDMYTYYGTKAYQARTFLDRDFPKKMRYAKPGDVVIVGAGENDTDIGVGLAWFGDEPAVVHDACYILEHNQNPMYISYYLRSGGYHQQIRKHVSDGKICSISADGIGKSIIAIPSKECQQEIVSILDKFESAIQTLEEELALRKKQYEYYREKLLTFKSN